MILPPARRCSSAPSRRRSGRCRRTPRSSPAAIRQCISSPRWAAAWGCNTRPWRRFCKWPAGAQRPSATILCWPRSIVACDGASRTFTATLAQFAAGGAALPGAGAGLARPHAPRPAAWGALDPAVPRRAASASGAAVDAAAALQGRRRRLHRRPLQLPASAARRRQCRTPVHLPQPDGRASALATPARELATHRARQRAAGATAPAPVQRPRRALEPAAGTTAVRRGAAGAAGCLRCRNPAAGRAAGAALARAASR